MALGTFIIALGLGLYFLVNVFLRRRIAIDDALFPRINFGYLGGPEEQSQ